MAGFICDMCSVDVDEPEKVGYVFLRLPSIAGLWSRGLSIPDLSIYLATRSYVNIVSFSLFFIPFLGTLFT